jgi:hypothetical protein
MRGGIYLGVLLAAVAFDSAAVTLYKSIDNEGHVTYSDREPKGFDGKVIPLNIDPNANEVSLLPHVPDSTSPATASDYERIIENPTAGNSGSDLRLAQQRFDAAKSALKDAQDNSPATDWTYLGNPAGTRRMPKPEYTARLDRLNAEVAAAQANLDQAYQRNRSGP